MSNHKPPNEILRFDNADPIEIKYERAINYTNCRNYDQKLMSQGFIWHQIVVMHQGKIANENGKKFILDAIFDIIGNEEFFPVAYRHTPREDKFLIRQCTPAMDKLFAVNLRICLSNGLNVPLKVQLNVAEYKFGQIAPKTRMAQAIQRLCKNLETIQNERGLLNLSSFDGNFELDGLEISLSNRVVLECICDLIYKNDEHYRFINGIILSYNGIKNVAPLQIFHSTYFLMLDLRHNDLNSAAALCRDLQSVKAKKLYLAGNPLTESPTYPGDLKALTKNFKFIDETPTENLSKDYTPVTRSDVSEESGYYIDLSNTSEVHKFEQSTYWHGIEIPDPGREYTKDEIFDYFFLTVSNDLDPIFPCYYKYSSGQHQFLLRQCFKQMVHLVEVANLELKIPRINMISLENPQPNGLQVTYEKVLSYSLRMHISPFKTGEVNPDEYIEKAINQRFNTMDRVLNMENFQSCKGLENIIINLSSPKVLEKVLCMAGQKLLGNCIEVRLAHNKILSGNFTKAFTLMSNVKAVDLGNNWIHDLQDIKTLQTIKIKALRLDGNPLCSQYAFAADYIEAVRNLFPDIHKLDNIEIKTTGPLSCQKNYLCDVRAYDFVEQFVPYYFNTFQSERKNLRGLYHPKTTFTMTCKYTPTQATKQNMNRRAKYRSKSRNVLCLENMSLAAKNFHFGADNAMNIFMELPEIVFDLLSFTVDVPIFLESMVVIIVNGVLSDQPSCILEGEIVLGFSRTFVLVPVERNAGVLKLAKGYQIMHDLFSVHNPSELQLKNSFKYCKNNELYENEEISTADKEAMLIMFQETTGLKSIWCTRCLGDANWSFEAALDVFEVLCKRNEIPQAAFI